MNHTLREYVEGVPYCLAGAFFALLSVGAFAGGHIHLGTAVVLSGLSVLAFAAPFQALLIFVAVSPIAAPLSALVAPNMDGQLLAELLVSVFLAGALFRFGLFKASRRPLTTAEILAVLLIFLVTTSALPALGPEYIRLSEGAPPLSWTWHLFSQDYFGGSGALRPLYEGMPFIEGLLLFIVFGLSISVQSATDAAVRMLVLGAAATAAFDIDKLLLVFARAGSLPQMLDVATHVRISMSTGDLNAAGSYFAMALVLAVAIIGVQPIIGVVLTAFVAVGEALAGSRMAFAALAVTVGATGLYFAAVARGLRRRVVLIVAVLVLAIAAVPGGQFLAHRSTNLSGGRALEYRLGMWEKAARMTRDHPLFGIGIGEFANNSPLYPPQSGVFSVPENAHNQFLQVMAELGIPGLLCFVAVIALSLAHRYGDWLAGATAIGIAAFLLSALGGHPLLIRTVAYAFWAALAIAHTAKPRTPASRPVTILAGLVIVALALAIPARAAEALDTADLEHIGVGVSSWITDASGDKYRVASSCARLYVPTRARRIEIGLRPQSGARASLTVEFWENGRLLNRIDLQAGEWTSAVFTGGMPDARERAFSPIELRVRRAGLVVPCGTDVVDVRKIVAVP